MSDDSDVQLRRVEELVAKARRYAAEDPEVALAQARKAAEAMCRIAFTREVGEPGKIMLDALLQKLVANKVIPASIQVPFGTLQAYGNYGSHAQSDARTLDSAYVAPAMAALDQVEAWFFDEYLKRPRAGSAPAAAPAASPKAPTKRRFPIAIAVALGAAVIAVVAVVMMTRGHDEQKPTPKTGPVAAAVPVDAAGSATAAPAPPDAPLPSDMKRAGDLALRYRVLARGPDDSEFHLVQKGEALTTNTRVSIDVQVSAPAYVFVVQRVRATGEIAVLFPEARIPIANPISKDTWVELPPSGKGYRLNDKDLGTETVYLIASKHPLPDLSRAIAGPAATKSASPVATQIVAIATEGTDCDKPRGLTLDDSSDCLERSRGLEADDEAVADAPVPASPSPRAVPAPARVVRARVNDDVVLVPFSFRHVAK